MKKNLFNIAIFLFVLLLGGFLIWLCFHLQNTRPNAHGFIYEYQSLIGGLLAFTAAIAAIFGPLLVRHHEKKNKCNSFFSNARAFINSVNREFEKGIHHAKKLHYIDVEWVFSDIDQFLMPDEIQHIFQVRHLLTEANFHIETIEKAETPVPYNETKLYYSGDARKQMEKCFLHSAEILETLIKNRNQDGSTTKR